MILIKISLGLGVFIAFVCCSEQVEKHGEHADVDSGETKKSEIHYAEESHLSNIRQLANGGDNAYWNSTNDALVFQATNKAWSDSCD